MKNAQKEKKKKKTQDNSLEHKERGLKTII